MKKINIYQFCHFLVIGLLFGLAVFIIEYISGFLSINRSFSSLAIILPSYIITFLIVSFSVGLLYYIRRKTIPFSVNYIFMIFFFFAVVINIYCIIQKLLINVYPLEEVRSHLLLSVFGFICFLQRLFFLRKNQRCLVNKLFSLCLFSILLLGWAFYSPEQIYLYQPACYWLNAFAIALFFAIIIKLRCSIPVSKKIDLTLAVILLLTAIIITVNYKTKNQPLNLNNKAGFHSKKHKFPNLIFIVLDTVRRDHLSVYGYNRETTPYLDKLSKESVVYTNLVSVSPTTIPSHATMFTGVYQREHGTHKFYSSELKRGSKDWRGLPSRMPTLAGILKQKGYRCGAVCANTNITKGDNFDQGFDYFFSGENPNYSLNTKFDLSHYCLMSLLPVIYPDAYFKYFTPTLTADQINKKTLNWVDSIDPANPFFLFINYIDSHDPYYPPGELLDKYAGFKKAVASKQVWKIWRETLHKNKIISAEVINHMISQYDANLVYLDSELKKLSDELSRRGIFDNSFILITSDHGEYLGEHNLLAHGKDVYSEVLNIPLIVRYPGGSKTGINKDLLDNRLIFNLILKQSGLTSAYKQFEWDAVSEYYRGYPAKLLNGKTIKYYNRTRRAVYYGKYKYIYSSDGNNELYDLADDPDESDNLIMNKPEITDKGEELNELFQKLIPEMKFKTSIKEMKQEEINKLKSLGYVH